MEKAVEFHGKLVDFYSKIESKSEKTSVKILVNYMARHENILKEQLSQISAEQQKQLTEEWLKYEPEFVSEQCFEDLKIDKDSGVDDIVDAALGLNQCLINFYHQVAEIAPTEELKILFSKLEVMEIAEKKKLARSRGM